MISMTTTTICPQPQCRPMCRNGALRTLQITLLATLLGIATHALEALDTVPALSDEHWSVQCNVHRLITSPYVQSFSKRPEYAQLQAGITFLTLLTGIDPTHDTALVTMRGVDSAETSALVYVQAHMDRSRLMALASTAKGYSSAPSGTHEIIHWIDTRNGVDKNAYGCLVTDALLIIAADSARMARALDVIDGHPSVADAGPAPLPVLAALAPEVLLDGSCVDMQQWKALAVQAELVRQVHRLDLAVTDSADALDLTATLGCTDTATATQIHDLIQGLVALGRLSQGGPSRGIVALITNSIHMTIEGTTVTIQAQVPVSAITAAIDGATHAAPVDAAPVPAK
jgi:hypothetical protein